jgi:hypothetical protein
LSVFRLGYSQASGTVLLHTERRRTMVGILWTIAVILFVLWLVGFLFAHVGGPLIHLLLVLAVIAVVYNLVTGRRVV